MVLKFNYSRELRVCCCVERCVIAQMKSWCCILCLDVGSFLPRSRLRDDAVSGSLMSHNGREVRQRPSLVPDSVILS